MMWIWGTNHDGNNELLCPTVANQTTLDPQAEPPLLSAKIILPLRLPNLSFNMRVLRQLRLQLPLHSFPFLRGVILTP